MRTSTTQPPPEPGTTSCQALAAYVKLMRAADTVTSRAHAHLARHHLSISQFGVLEALLHRGPLNQSQLGQKLLKSSGNITVVLDHLEQRGLVERQRNPEDRRCVTVSLSPSGRELVARVFPPHADGVRAAMAVLSPAELEQLSTLCRKLGLGAAPNEQVTQEQPTR